MKIVFQKEVFLRKLLSASRFTSSRLSSLTALQGILIKGEKNNVGFYSTNLSSYYYSFIKTSEKQDFEIVVEPKKLIEFLSLLPEGEIEIKIEEKQIIISKGKIRGEFPLISSKDFPLPPPIEEKSQKIQSDFFLKSLPLVLFSAATDDSRPVLTGVNLVSQDEDLLMVTTDGFRLSLLKLKKEINLPSMIIPSSFLTEAVNFIKDEKEIELKYSPKEKIICLIIGDNHLYSRLIEGDYPPFEKVIPTEQRTKIEVDKDDFLRNIKLTSIFARDISNIVVIEVGEREIKLKPKTEKSGQNITQQEADTQGEKQKIAFNYKFVLDFLNHLEAEKVSLEFLRSDSPAVFKSDKHPNFLHIIMPVRIQE